MKKRYVAAGILLLLFLLAYSQRAALVLLVLPGAAEKAMTSDIVEELGDGLHVALCGAGGPMPDPRRAGSCVAVVAGDNLLVVDAGTGGARNLIRLRYPLGEINALFLTHFHSDHIDGLGEMAMMRWVNGANQTPLPVYGPEGVADVVAGFNEAYARDAPYRNEHHGDGVAPLGGAGMTPVSFPVPAEGESVVIYEHAGIVVETFVVDHHPAWPAVAYLFRYKGRSALVSGDTSKSANLEAFAKGVDLLVHDALAPNLVNIMEEAASNVGNDRIAKIASDIPDYHATPVEVAETARDAGVGHLLYYHIVPPMLLPGAEAAWLLGVDEVFADYTVGVDGVTFSLPPESTEIRKVRSGL